MYKNNAKLFVISAPSGCGKGTILGEVFKNRDVFYSVSCTTRSPREGEVDGVHYHFITDDGFKKMIDQNEFLEHAGYVKHFYGTPKKPVFDNLEQGRDVVLEIETNGAFQVKKAFPEAVLMFILPPSVKEIERRLKKRGTETEEVIQNRVSEAAGEIAKAVDYDYVIMNDGLEEAVDDFVTVMNSVKAEDGAADKFKAENEDTKKLIDEVLNHDA
ncbi:guanylate kinase [Ruminococcus sp.]|uniref:guanylate kinase n=1 Tax=Ruminococcus sp. TaxID=41978 RepID=UPI0025F0CFE4|nr:guanylate kinase [Ruminococcus sp.]